MKTRMSLFLAALALSAVAFVSASGTAQARKCQAPECFASPGCCYDYECDEWCEGKGLGRCEGGGQGGCCYCAD